MTVIRNSAGNITSIEGVSKDKARQYRSAFFTDDLSTADNTQNMISPTKKYDAYSAYGITLSSDGEVLLYNGQRVKLLVDELSDGSFETFWFDESGTVNLSVVRDSAGQILSLESISEKKAKEYHSAADKYEQNVLSGLDKKIEEKLKELYPENNFPESQD